MVNGNNDNYAHFRDVGAVWLGPGLQQVRGKRDSWMHPKQHSKHTRPYSSRSTTLAQRKPVGANSPHPVLCYIVSCFTGRPRAALCGLSCEPFHRSVADMSDSA